MNSRVLINVVKSAPFIAGLVISISSAVSAAPSWEESGKQVEKQLRARLATCRKQYGNKSEQTADALENLAHCSILQRDREIDSERIRLIREALPIRKQSYNPAKFAEAFGHTGVVTMKTPGAQYAIDLWQIGKTLESRPQAKRNGSAQAFGNNNVVLRIKLDDVDAVAIWKELVQMSSKSLGEEHPTTTEFMLDLGQCQSNAEDYSEAEKTLMKVLATEQKRNLRPNKYSRESWCLSALRNMYINSQNDRKAEIVLKQEMDYLRKCEGDGPFMAGTLQMYSELLRRAGRNVEALAMEQHAEQIRQSTGVHQEHVVKAVLVKPATN